MFILEAFFKSSGPSNAMYCQRYFPRNLIASQNAENCCSGAWNINCKECIVACQLANFLRAKTKILVVTVAHIYPLVTGQRQTLTTGRSAHFSLHWLLRDWKNPHLLMSFEWSNVSVDFFEFLTTEFAACSKPPSRDDHRKASYPRTQQRDQSRGWTQIMRSGSSLKRRLLPFGHAADFAAFTIRPLCRLGTNALYFPKITRFGLKKILWIERMLLKRWLRPDSNSKVQWSIQIQ